MPSSDLQALLVHHEIVTVEQVRHAMTATRGTGTTWIEYLLLSRQLEEETLARCAGTAVRAPRCDLGRLAHVPRHVVAELPGDLAIEHRMVPLGIEPDGDLRVGMIDPCDAAAVQEVEFFLGRRVLREVVPATWLLWALYTYYGARCALWPRQERPAAPRPSQRFAHGTVHPPLAAEAAYDVDIVGAPLADELAYDVEIVHDDAVELAGAPLADDLAYEVEIEHGGEAVPSVRERGSSPDA